MNADSLHVRMTPSKGRGLFASRPFRTGELLVRMEGWLSTTEQLDENWLAVQVGQDSWLCSTGELLDDCGNHSCEPNAGFTTGEPVLFALRDIAAGEEICWDYSTSMNIADWSLECRCGSPKCRRVVLPWSELGGDVRQALRPIALAYLREG